MLMSDWEILLYQRLITFFSGHFLKNCSGQSSFTWKVIFSAFWFLFLLSTYFFIIQRFFNIFACFNHSEDRNIFYLSDWEILLYQAYYVYFSFKKILKGKNSSKSVQPSPKRSPSQKNRYMIRINFFHIFSKTGLYFFKRVYIFQNGD